MEGKVFLVVGARGSGKTYFLRSKLALVHPDARLVYDLPAQYKDLYPYPLPDFDEFTKKGTQVSGAVILIEEATVTLSNRGSDKDVKNFLVKSRYMGNTIFIVFHSLRSVPRYIYDLTEFIILFKTNDSPDLVWDNFKHEILLQKFNEIKAADWIADNSVKGCHSPFTIVSLY